MSAPFHPQWHLVSSLIALLVGSGASVAHLGRPGCGFYAFGNLKRSWLSREAAATGLLVVVLAVAVLTGLSSGVLSRWIVFAGSLVGGILLYAMSRAYRLRTVPSWDNAGTLFGFLGSALLLGGLQFTLVSHVLTAAFGTSSETLGQNSLHYIGLLVALAGLIFKIQAQGANRPQNADSGTPFSLSQPLLQGSGLLIRVVSLLFNDARGLQWTLLFLAAAAVIGGEIIHRILFYKSYRSAGL